MKTKLRPFLGIVVLLGILGLPSPARSDIFGGDDIILAEILANALDQLAQLQQILGSADSNLDLIREINAGINDSLRLIRTVFPNFDPGIYKDWDKLQKAQQGVQSVYGAVPDSADAAVQRNTDQSVAEAITLNNAIYDYSRDIDDIGEQIKEFSHDASPGGAAKLTAQSLGVLLNVANQSLRTQATGLKLQAQALALENRREKEATRFSKGTADSLAAAMDTASVDFKIPRF